MSNATVQPGQSLLDIAIQYCGSLEALGELARLNGLDVSATLTAGDVLAVPEVANKRVRRILADLGVVPASSEEGLGLSVLLPAVPVNISATYNIPGAVVEAGQSLADIAIQYLGNISALPDMAQLNGLTITDQVEPGTRLQLPAVVTPAVVTYMSTGGYAPASNVQDELEGIGYWGIEYDFIVT